MIPALLLLALSQSQSEKLYREGNDAFQSSQFGVAILKYEAALKLESTNAEYSRSAGAAYASQKQFAAALPYFEKACRATPRLALACYQWGRTLFFMNRHQEALAAYEEAAGSPALGEVLYSARAQALDALGRHAEAGRDFRLALAENALRPQRSAEVQLLYGNFLARRGLHPAALWQFQQALRKTPYSATLWEEQAKSLLVLERLPEAAESLEQALSHGPRVRNTLLLLAAVYARLGDESKSRAALNEANSARP